MACMGACMVYFGVCLGENGGCPRPPPSNPALRHMRARRALQRAREGGEERRRKKGGGKGKTP